MPASSSEVDQRRRRRGRRATAIPSARRRSRLRPSTRYRRLRSRRFEIKRVGPSGPRRARTVARHFRRRAAHRERRSRRRRRHDRRIVKRQRAFVVDGGSARSASRRHRRSAIDVDASRARGSLSTRSTRADRTWLVVTDAGGDGAGVVDDGGADVAGSGSPNRRSRSSAVALSVSLCRAIGGSSKSIGDSSLAIGAVQRQFRLRRKRRERKIVLTVPATVGGFKPEIAALRTLHSLGGGTGGAMDDADDASAPATASSSR